MQILILVKLNVWLLHFLKYTFRHKYPDLGFYLVMINKKKNQIEFFYSIIKMLLVAAVIFPSRFLDIVLLKITF